MNADMGHCQSCGNVMPEQILKMVEAKQVDEYGKITAERKVAPREWYDIYRDRIEANQKIKTKKKALPRLDFHIPPPRLSLLFSFAGTYFPSLPTRSIC